MRVLLKPIFYWPRLPLGVLLAVEAQLMRLAREAGAQGRTLTLERIDLLTVRAFAWLDRALESWPVNLHIVTNLVIEIEGDTARSRCYFHAPMGRNLAGDEQLIITNAGRYEDKLVRTTDGWRIVERVCHQTIMQGSLPEGYEIPS